ncbi:MAG: class I SAM-dependent methyltransferase [Candidatus Paceibacterota bacterium]
MKNSDYWKNKWLSRPLEPANNFAVRSYKLIKNKKSKTLLDVGCGNGRDSVYFFNKGLKIIAVDFSASGIKKIKSQNPKIKCVLADIKKMKLKANSFDVIYAHLSLHYFDDKTTNKIFNNLHHTLKKNGLIFIKCKSVADALFGKGQKIEENMYKKGHTRHFFSKDYMSEKLKSFKIIKISKTSSVYHNYKSAFIEAVATK